LAALITLPMRTLAGMDERSLGPVSRLRAETAALHRALGADPTWNNRPCGLLSKLEMTRRAPFVS
jgi:hypothetical protein